MAGRNIGRALLRACVQGSLQNVKIYAPTLYGTNTGIKVDKTIAPPLKITLATAAQNGHSDILHYLLTEMPQCQQATEGPWNPPLEVREEDLPEEWNLAARLPELVIVQAVISNKPETFQTLMDFGLEVDYCLDKLVTPLAVAIQHQRTDMVRFLLSKGASASGQFWLPGFTLLGLATTLSSVEILQILLAAGTHIKGSHALRQAAAAGRIDAATVLLDYGADINEIFDLVTADGGSRSLGTALHAAIKSEQTSFVRFLLERGARIDLPDGNGVLARQLAEDLANTDVVALLSGRTQCGSGGRGEKNLRQD